jgi:O-antigen/teichoic acid export membrane protein
MFHLYKLGPHIFPTLRLWDGTLVPKILKQSGYFALIFSSNFLVYQVPILILQKTAGGSLVALFSIMRTIFSMTRLMLNSPTQSMGPEVTSLFAINDWKGLSRLYDYSERLIFSIIPIVNLGVLYLCPFLLQVWLKQPLLFVPHVYLLGAAASIVMSTKEHKFQFQFSTNTHRELARFMFGSYIFLGVLWAIFIPRFGIQGLMVCWLSIEMCQLSYLIWLNAQLFRHHEVLDKKYLIRLALLSLAFLAGGYVLLPYTRFLPLPRQVVIAVANCVLLLGLAIPLFHLIPVWGKVQERLRRRFA